MKITWIKKHTRPGTGAIEDAGVHALEEDDVDAVEDLINSTSRALSVATSGFGIISFDVPRSNINVGIWTTP